MRNQIDESRPLLDMKLFPDYETVQEAINIFARRYGIVAVTSIGETPLGKSLYMIDIGAPEAEKEVLYVASHSAADYITTLVLLRFVNEYCEYYKSSSVAFGINIRKLFQNRCIHIVPCLNADGVDIHLKGVDKSCILYDRLLKMSGGDYTKWRCNARGVDLRFNYGTGFFAHKEIECQRDIAAGCEEFSGILPESENETGALANYLRFNDKIKGVVSLQLSGERIGYTAGGKCPGNAYSIAKQMQLLSGYSIDEQKDSTLCSKLKDWCIEELGIPSFEIYCGNGEPPLPLSDFYKIYSDLRRMLFSFPLLI